MTPLARAPRALLNLERAAELLRTTRDVGTIIEIKNAASAAAHFARARRAGVQARNDATAVELTALRLLGVFLREHGPKRGRPGKNVERDDIFERYGITRDESSRAQRLAKASAADFEAFLAHVQSRGELLTMKGAIAAASHAEDYDGDEHYTPPEIVEAARATMGSIDVDPASCELAQTVVRAGRFYTASDSGLEREWRGNVLLNSPFSQPLERLFTEKLLDELQRKRARQCVRVMNAITETQSFHACASRALACFVAGRLNFLRPNGGELAQTKGNRYSQVVLYFGRRHDAFRREFSRFGLIGALR